MGVGMDQLIALVLGQGSSWVGQPTSSPSPALHLLAYPVEQEARGRASSSVLAPSGLAHSHLHQQGQLFCITQARCKATFLSAVAEEGQD